MKQIPIRGKFGEELFALVDDCDYALVSQWRWKRLGRMYVNYAYGTQGRSFVSMHRLIMGAKPGQLVDHINGNGLDNRRENLRICTQTINNLNRHNKVLRKSSRYKGVHFSKKESSWVSSITISGKKYDLGSYLDEEAARSAHIAARDNFVDNGVLPKNVRSPRINRFVEVFGELDLSSSYIPDGDVLPINNTSGYRGVTYAPYKKRFRVKLHVNGIKYHVGYYKTAHEGGLAYWAAVKRVTEVSMWSTL